MAERRITYVEALREAHAQALREFPELIVMGLGVTDPTGVFGSTKGLHTEFPGRAFDLPLSEEGTTGIAHGMAMAGMRVLYVHQRVDFLLLTMNQIVNHAAKWRFMFASQGKMPVVYRAVIGRGWGQGAQHSQSLQSLFAHIPGLSVIMPTSPYDAKGLLIEAVRSGRPVICLEHRNLYGLQGAVPEEPYGIPLGKGLVRREGRHVTIVAVSQMVLEAEKAADLLAAEGVEAEVIDARSVAPLDEDLILASVRKTGALVACDTSWAQCGFTAEVLARVTEKAFDALRSAPVRVALPPIPTPSSPVLEAAYYPNAATIAAAVRGTLHRPDAPAPTIENLRAQKDSW